MNMCRYINHILITLFCLFFNIQISANHNVCNNEITLPTREISKQTINIGGFNINCNGLLGIVIGLSPKEPLLNIVPDKLKHLPAKLIVTINNEYGEEILKENRVVELDYRYNVHYVVLEFISKDIRSGNILLDIESSDLLFKYYSNVISSIGPLVEIY